MQIKNWKKWQGRLGKPSPPWIKLYRSLLEDPEFYNLDAETSKKLVLLWLLASEDKKLSGNLPEHKDIAFKLRIPIESVPALLDKVAHFLVSPDEPIVQSDKPTIESVPDKPAKWNPLDDFNAYIARDMKRVCMLFNATESEITHQKHPPKLWLETELAHMRCHISEHMSDYKEGIKWPGFVIGWLKRNTRDYPRKMTQAEEDAYYDGKRRREGGFKPERIGDIVGRVTDATNV